MRFLAVKRVTAGSASVGETPYATPTANGGISISGATAVTGGGACCAADGAGAFVAGVDAGCCCAARFGARANDAMLSSATHSAALKSRYRICGLFMAARAYRERCFRRREERADTR